MNVAKISSAFAVLTLTLGCGGRLLDLGGPGADASPAGNDVTVAGWSIERMRNPRSLRGDGAYLYWIADRDPTSAILRCEKRDCAKTVVALFELESGTGLASIDIRGQTIYAIDARSIYSCPAAGCTTLTPLATEVRPSAIAFDDVNIYWSSRADAKVFGCPIAGCSRQTTTIRVDSVDAVELAVDETSIFWTSAGPSYPKVPEAVMFAPKDRSTPAKILAARQNQAASLVVRDGFIWWTTSFSAGKIARCPVAGCATADPEILADGQYFPHFLNVVDGAIFWMNGSGAPGDPRAVQISSCSPTSCPTTIEVLAQGTGGSSGVRTRTVPPQEMVVDHDAIYWIGDVVNVGPPGNDLIKVDGSIRRTERRRSR